MIATMYGYTGNRPISAEDVLRVLEEEYLKNVADDEEQSNAEMIEKIIEQVKALPTIKMPDGKALVQKRYPCILVIDCKNPNDGMKRVGDDTHDRLVVKKSGYGSHVAYENSLSMEGNEFAAGGYAFAGEWLSEHLMVAVPFDTVWVEEGENGR